MSAVVGVLNESLTESIKGFYKLRKAYLTLDAIMEAEARYMKAGLGTPRNKSTESFRSSTSARSLKGMPGGFADGNGSAPSSRPPSIRSSKESKAETVAQAKAVYNVEEPKAREEDEEEFYDADEDHDDKTATDQYAGHVEINGAMVNLEHISLDTDEDHLETPKTPPNRPGLLDHDPESDIFKDPIDVFIHSGANLCFGLLLVMIAMIPPAFGVSTFRSEVFRFSSCPKARNVLALKDTCLVIIV